MFTMEKIKPAADVLHHKNCPRLLAYTSRLLINEETATDCYPSLMKLPTCDSCNLKLLRSCSSQELHVCNSPPFASRGPVQVCLSMEIITSVQKPCTSASFDASVWFLQSENINYSSPLSGQI
ncbi:hypothetical protein Dimus_000517 [Dionaea muscipula]